MRAIHIIVVYPRNAANVNPHVVLEPLNYEAFRTSLEGMGYKRDDITKYSNESGRSLTVLRRRLSNVPAIRTPEWAADRETAVSLIPFLFVGAWSSTNSIDRFALEQLTDVNPYETLEKTCQRLTTLNDAPLWSIGTYRGVVSKIDLLFAIANWITVQDLERYFILATCVLDEDDPKLDLPESERWMAAIYGKSREFSAALRRGVSETFVLLSVHGNHLFRARLGFDCEVEAARLVRELLAPLKTRVLEANDRDLPVYAEAAPDEFLSILEDDLKSSHPESYGLIRPAESGILGVCARTGLLWALESLAWNPETLPRTALILAQLAEIEINDNWANKPISSLESIFRSWMPQTAVSHDERLAVMKLLADKFPNVAWKVCVEQIDTGSRTGHYNYKPSWRTDGHGYGEPFPTWDPINSFVCEMIEMALGWKSHTREMLCDLIERLHDLSDEHQAKVWELVKSWADADASEADKAFVRENIRVAIMSRRGVKRSERTNAASLLASAKAAYQSLEPSDVLNKHEWLFREVWVMESADELHDGDLDFDKREERIAKQRADALREVLSARGVSGVIGLAEMGKATFQIGWLMATDVLQGEEISTFLLEALPPASNGKSWTRQNLVSGALRSIRDETKRACLLMNLKKQLSHADLSRLLLCAPFCRSTWQMVDELDEAHCQTYWNEVVPDLIRDSDSENNEAIERLLAAQRPRAAFACVKYKLEAIKPELLFRLMSEIVKDGQDQPGHYQLDQYHVKEAFKLMDKSPELNIDQKASLDLAYIDSLSRPWSSRETFGIPNLEKYVEAHPEFFVQAVVWTYRREDDGEDPQEWKVAPEKIQHFADLGYKLLNGLKRIPGCDDLGELKVELLTEWVKTVREACAELGRLEITDECLGKLMSGAPADEDGVWPCEPVRQVMEDIQSKSLMEGAHVGLFNSGGATWRHEGGDQERELADRYRAWANALQYSHPFVASQLLMSMVKTYEDMAEREDDEARIRQRLL